MVSKKTRILFIGLVLVLVCSFIVMAGEYQQAPVLDKLVEEGKLPPVAERLPGEPIIIKPLHNIGKYGGTWKRFTTNVDWSAVSCMMDGYRIINWDSSLKPGQATAKVVPQLAKSWDSNEDKSVWTFYFRDVKWSDGVPFTVDDILFWWEDMALNKDVSVAVPSWAVNNGVSVEMTKIDDLTLEFKFEGPNPVVLKKMICAPRFGDYFNVVPKHYLEQYHPAYNSEYSDAGVLEEKAMWWHNPECPVLTAWKPIKEERGSRLILERNPYFYGVDTAGNQLPYIDRIEVEYLANPEIYKLKLSRGESDMQIQGGPISLRDIAMFKQNESQYDYRTLLWDGGSGTGPLFYLNRTHQNPDKRKLYSERNFNLALSYAINRDRINKMVYFNTGQPTTGTLSTKTPFFYRYPEGKALLEEWVNLAVEFNPEKAKQLLDDLGIKDVDGDGWRELANGKKLQLRIDVDAEGVQDRTDVSEMVKIMWEEIGLKTIVNPMDPAKLTAMNRNGTFDIRDSWEVGGPPSVIAFPQWAVPMDPSWWSPLYGQWYSIQGTPQQDVDLDLDPFDRQPPWMTPPENSPERKLQILLDKASLEPSQEARDELIKQMVRLHIDEGPFFIGTVNGQPRVGVVKNYMKNVPTKDELSQGGWVNPFWNVHMHARIEPQQFYIDK